VSQIRKRDIQLLSEEERRRVQPIAVQMINDFVTGARAVNDRGQSYLKCHGRAQFVDRMQQFLIRENIGKPHGIPGSLTLHDIRSENRLLLIWDANVKRWWKPRNRNPDEPLKYL
jgi:hypothetical protein